MFFPNNQSRLLAKNTFWLFSGQIIGRVLRAVLVIFAARILGPESWGAFSYGMGLIAFFLIFSDLGIGAIVTRESAKDQDVSHRYFATALIIKAFPLIIGVLLLIFGNRYLSNISEAQQLLPFISLVLIFDSLRNFGFALSRSFQKMEWEAFNEILTNIVIVLLGFLFLKIEPTSAYLTYAYIGGTAAGFMLTWWLFHSYFRNLFSSFTPALIKPILSASLPFAFASFLGAIMINTDLLMVGWLRSPEELGWYSAAQKPVQLLYVFASLFATSLFPLLSKSVADTATFRSLLEKALRIALLAAIPITLIGVIFAQPLIQLFFGNQYLSAIGTFQILMLTILIIYPSVIVSNAILAFNQQRYLIIFSLIGALGNVILNYLLIPIFGIAGCALATLATQILANAFNWYRLRRIIDFSILH
ncbi:MAG TPA: flippase [Candidatus Paceibacterota bacterium]